jgi:hypothetical protein
MSRPIIRRSNLQTLVDAGTGCARPGDDLTKGQIREGSNPGGRHEILQIARNKAGTPRQSCLHSTDLGGITRNGVCHCMDNGSEGVVGGWYEQVQAKQKEQTLGSRSNKSYLGGTLDEAELKKWGTPRLIRSEWFSAPRCRTLKASGGGSPGVW